MFNDHLADADAVVERLQPFDVVCVMRERARAAAEASTWALILASARLNHTRRGPEQHCEVSLSLRSKRTSPNRLHQLRRRQYFMCIGGAIDIERGVKRFM